VSYFSWPALLISRFSDFPPPITEPRLSFGFETHTEPKLIALLSDPVEEKRLSSLSLLYTHIAQPEKVIRVLQSGLTLFFIQIHLLLIL
jgi:hypothetical protein